MINKKSISNKFKNLTIIEKQFNKYDFWNSEFKNSKFINCKFENCIFADVTFENVKFENCEVKYCNFQHASFIKSNIWTLLPAGKAKFKKGEIVDCFFSNHSNQTLI